MQSILMGRWWSVVDKEQKLGWCRRVRAFVCSVCSIIVRVCKPVAIQIDFDFSGMYTQFSHVLPGGALRSTI